MVWGLRPDRVKDSFGTLAAMHDWRSRARLLKIKLRSQVGAQDHNHAALRVRELGGSRLHVRPRTTDMDAILLNYVKGAHLPPPGVRERDLGQICEFGSHIGTGLAGLAARYPSARVLGVEPDPENAALARRNTEAFGARCEVIETAIWDRETELTIAGDNPTGYSVRPSEPGDPVDRRIRATTVDRVLAEHMPEGRIDYMVLQLEKTEPRVLAAADGWAERVDSIRVEIYPGMGFEGPACVDLLERLGFEAWWEPTPSRGYGFGIRPDRLSRET